MIDKTRLVHRALDKITLPAEYMWLGYCGRPGWGGAQMTWFGTQASAPRPFQVVGRLVACGIAVRCAGRRPSCAIRSRWLGLGGPGAGGLARFWGNPADPGFGTIRLG
jgi:hypothetical protein